MIKTVLLVLGLAASQTLAQEFVSWEAWSRGVTANGYPAPRYDQFENFNREARVQGRISTTQEAAMALAQLLHESDGLRANREYACQNPPHCPNSYRTPGCDQPGQFYYGRGYIQLTWCENYKSASRGIFGGDASVLQNDPDRVAREDWLSWSTAFWYWGNVVHDAPGVQQGQFGASTRAINGALECGTGSPTPEIRFQKYSIIRQQWGLDGPGDRSGC